MKKIYIKCFILALIVFCWGVPCLISRRQLLITSPSHPEARFTDAGRAGRQPLEWPGVALLNKESTEVLMTLSALLPAIFILMQDMATP